MSQPNEPFDPDLPPFPDEAIAEGPPPQPEPPPPRLSAVSRVLLVVSWLVIIGFVVLSLILTGAAEEARAEKPDGDRIGLIVLRGQARYLLGARQVIGPEDTLKQAASLNTGPVPQRLAFVILAGEIAGPDQALKQLAELDAAMKANGVTMTDQQRRLRGILERLYRDYAALRLDGPSVKEDQRRELYNALGWFAELALTPAPVPQNAVAVGVGGAAALALGPPGGADPAAREEVMQPANRAFAAYIAAFGGGCFLGLAGLIGLTVFVVLLARGRLRGSIDCQGPARGSVYAETFALWLVLFTGFGLLGALVPRDGPRLLLGGAAGMLSLIVLGWPVLRGVPWRQVREDIGLTAGRTPAAEPFWGVACYAMTLPVLAIAVIASYLLLVGQRGGPAADNFEPSAGPAHPVIVDVAQADTFMLIELLFLASVAAPVVEEIMFRGVLYRHLRELSCRWGPVLSFIVSAVVVSAIFAAIHPQGLIGIPVLAALALGFTAAREWRGTLVPAMVAHGLNNGLVLLVTYAALAG